MHGREPNSRPLDHESDALPLHYITEQPVCMASTCGKLSYPCINCAYWCTGGGLHDVAPVYLSTMCQPVSENIDRHSLRSAPRGDLTEGRRVMVPAASLWLECLHGTLCVDIKNAVKMQNCTLCSKKGSHQTLGSNFVKS